MKQTTLLFLIALSTMLFSQPPYIQPRLFAKPKSDCDNQIKVRDNRPTTCDYEMGCETMYPVLIEEFDCKNNLPNLWSFDLGYTKDDDVGIKCYDRATWYGNCYNNNIELTGGIAHLILKQEAVSTVTPNSTCGAANYNFTSGMINSLNTFRTGVFEARIKIPKCNKMWPAFWLLNGGRSPAYGEIDIFEFYDSKIGANGNNNSNCDTYSLHKMSLHTGPTGNTCEQGDKYPVANNFFDDFHTYKLEWTDYAIRIYVDGKWKGFATRYFEFPSQFFSECQWGAANNKIDPLLNYDCNAMDNKLPDELFPFIDKKVMERSNWPTKNTNMHLIINNNLNFEYGSDNIMADYTQSEVNLLIDYVKVYQPFCCQQNRYFCSEQQLDAITYDSEILTGKTITVNDLTNNCVYTQTTPHAPEWWASPTILLATDEIAMNAAVEIPGGDRYFEARIIDCNNSMKLSQRNAAEEDSILQVLEQNVLDSMLTYYPTYADSLFYVYGDSVFYINPGNKMAGSQPFSNHENSTGLQLEKGDYDISISPIPANSNIEIHCNEEVFSRIKYIYIITSDGKIIQLPPSRTIELSSLVSGVYCLKFEFLDYSILNRKFVKS